jgi:hypothetical protein
MLQSIPDPRSSALPAIRRREIIPDDIDGIVCLLTDGFHVRKRSFWERALAVMSAHPTPPGYPKYGYLLECNGIPVGVTLMIYSAIVDDGRPRVRCSMSSWYVKPGLRAFAAQITAHVFQQKEVTFFNITPVRNTLPVLEARGYKQYCSGRFVALPALSAWRHGACTRRIGADLSADKDLSAFEVQLLLDHRSYGCISVTCSLGNRRYPFVFQPRRKARLPYAYLVYCRHLEDFVRLAGSLGRFLALHGTPLVVVDANGPIAGLVGRYYDGFPKYFRGPDQPRLGDLAYSEKVLFGI